MSNFILPQTKLISSAKNEDSSISAQAEGAKPSGMYFYFYTHTQVL